MATAGVPPASLELLQQYSIDLKDFTKARTRYRTVLQNELVPQKDEEANPDVIAATEEARKRLCEAWQDYLTSAQAYFSRLVRAALKDLGVESGEAPPAITITVNGTKLAANSQSDNPLEDNGTDATQASTSNSTAPPTEASAPPPEPSLTLYERAERMSDFCTLCEKWYMWNETTFELPVPQLLAVLAATSIGSPSRLLRLLGMRIAYVCAGNLTFLRAFMDHPEACRWAAMCGDRELYAEVEALLNLMDRMLSFLEEDANAYPRIPFGWYYRVSALLDPSEQMPNLPTKRRVQAMKVAMKALRIVPAQATAAELHVVLLRTSLAKGGPNPEEVEAIVRLIVQLFDNSSTRQYMRLADIGVVFRPFLDTCTPDPAMTNQADTLAVLNNARDILVLMLSSWVGNFWIASETTFLRALIDTLHLPGNLDCKMVILTMFNKLLVRIAPHRGIKLMDRWTGIEDDRRKRAAESALDVPSQNTMGNSTFTTNPTFEGMSEHGQHGSTPTANNNNTFGIGNTSVATYDTMLQTSIEDADIQEDFIPTTKALGYHALDPLLGRVLVTLNYHGLPLALVGMMQNMGSNRVALEAASSLLQDLFVLMDTVLPKSAVSSLHETFNRAVGYLAKLGDYSLGGLNSQLFHGFRTQNSADRMIGVEPVAAAVTVPSGSGGGGLNADEGSCGTDVDDATFQGLITESRVLSSPTDYRAWRMDTLLLLVQGPLRRESRLRESMNLLRIVVAFYTPREDKTSFIVRPFCTLKEDEVGTLTCLLGLELLDLLFSSRQGTQLLVDLDYPKAIAAFFKEVRGGAPRILPKDRVNSRVGQTTLRMIGRLSGNANGLLLMREYGLFDSIDGLFSKLQGTRVTSPPDGDTLYDVCYQLLQYLYLGAVPNYGVCDEIRHTYREALRNPSNAIRLCAAMQLKRAVWRDLSTSMKWGIETLVQALQDDFFSVVESAFKLLLSICLCSDEGLDYLISLFPTVLMESEVILSHAKQLRLDALLYCIASRTSGFRFLQCYGWIEKELRKWEATESARYAELVEQLQSCDSNLGPVPSAAGGGGGSMAGRSPASARDDHVGRRHTRSFSDAISGKYKGTTPATPATQLALLTTSAADRANFFPVHFAAVLCCSTEGCNLFKKSELWNRSVQRVLAQPQPPDIVYDDAASEDSESSEESADEDLAVAAESSHLVIPRTGGSTGASVHYRSHHLSLHSHGVGDTNASTSAAVSGASVGPPGAVTQGGGASGCACGPTCGAGDDKQLSAKDIQQLQKGRLSAPNTLISAARGYQPIRQTFSMDCVGDPLALKDAILCVCEAASSDTGYAMLRAVPGLQRRIEALNRFISTVSIRCMTMIGTSIVARSKRGSDELARQGCTVLSNMNAYVSADGVPYAVSFAHMKPSKCMAVTIRRGGVLNTTARHAYADYEGLSFFSIPKRVRENIFSLCNPVSRETAKKTLYRIMKRHPSLFCDANVRRLCLYVGSTYRMRHAERKFIADLLENAQLTMPASSNMTSRTG